MTASSIHKAIADLMPALYDVTTAGERERVRTPLLYPDGDVIDVYCRKQDDTITVSDLGETTRWLRMQTASVRKTVKQKALVEDACLTHNVEFYKGMLVARCKPGDDIAAVVTRVAQAALRVSDLWFTFRTRSVESAHDEVADYLREHSYDFQRGEKIPGRSGRVWEPDFHVRTVARSSLVYMLSTGSKASARGIVNQVVTAWYDLSHLAIGREALQLVSLFDDTSDVWAEEDFKLVGDLSTVARWSNPTEFEGVLSKAA